MRLDESHHKRRLKIVVLYAYLLDKSREETRNIKKICSVPHWANYYSIASFKLSSQYLLSSMHTNNDCATAHLTSYKQADDNVDIFL